MRQGDGKITFSNGNSYEGNWADDKYKGYGIYLWTDGRQYIGLWKNDKRQGQGVMIYSNGDTYDGDWANDMYEEYGVYTQAPSLVNLIKGKQYRGTCIKASKLKSNNAHM